MFNTTCHVLPLGELQQRLWSKVEKSNGCWLWRGATRNGYGILSVGGPTATALGLSRSAAQLAHRLVWRLERGPIPTGLFVCHKCDNPPCVRPEHLFIGTAYDNSRDMEAKGRRRGPPRLPDKPPCVTCKLTPGRLLGTDAKGRPFEMGCPCCNATGLDAQAKYGIHHGDGCDCVEEAIANRPAYLLHMEVAS